VTVVKQPTLKITFHNPNTVEETAAVLVKIVAEAAAEKVRQQLIHSDMTRELPAV